MIKKILVAIDGSELSKKALNFALDIAEKYTAKIELISVVHHTLIPPVAVTAVVPTPTSAGIIKSYQEEVTKSHERILNEFIKEAKKVNPDVEISAKIMEGRPSDTIVNVAEEEKFDIIVMGSRGLSGIKKFFLGSVSDGVVNESTCPVLIVK